MYSLYLLDDRLTCIFRRNESNDFVVDDDGIGYKDDGEEHLGIVEDPYEAKKRKLLEESEREDRKSNSKFKKLAPTQKKGIDAFLRSGHSAARPVFHEPAAGKSILLLVSDCMYIFSVSFVYLMCVA